MTIVGAGLEAVRGTVAERWPDFLTAPGFDEQTLVAPAVVAGHSWKRRTGPTAAARTVSDGSRVAVPENTALVVLDGGAVVCVCTEPGYFVFRKSGGRPLHTEQSAARDLIMESWERLRFGGRPPLDHRLLFVNLRELRNVPFGTPAPLPYRDESLVSAGAQAPVLRLRARGQFSVRVVDPVRLLGTLLPPTASFCSLAEPPVRSQLTQEFITAFQASLQSLSRTTPISALASHGPRVAAELSSAGGPGRSWRERFGLEVASVAIAAVEYDQASLDLMNKYNQGSLLSGEVGESWNRSAVTEGVVAMTRNGPRTDDVMGVALGSDALRRAAGTPGTAPAAGDRSLSRTEDPVVTLSRLKEMLDKGLISSAQYAEKQQEVLDRM